MPNDDDDALTDSRFLYTDADHQEDPEYIKYGDIKLWVAPKEGKATTLLADQLFSPSLLIAEAIERGVIPVDSKTIVELGSGTALPSLLAASQQKTPTIVTITDYPDESIMRNLEKNVNGNRQGFTSSCRIECAGYRWGDDVTPLRQGVLRDLISSIRVTDMLYNVLRSILQGRSGYDIVILSDLLHFRSSHDDLIMSMTALLGKEASARAYIAAGKYTPPEVCQNFLQEAERLGIKWQVGENDGVWRGTTEVGTWSADELSARKSNVNWWIGKWKHPRAMAEN
ncbi:hypothetical protein FRB94_001500 [Tulasnella sp. JGI-2019a]|nr:hypothetical protein FRB94_001500 [Tulasnella sp. JGI-2019a]